MAKEQTRLDGSDNITLQPPRQNQPDVPMKCKSSPVTSSCYPLVVWEEETGELIQISCISEGSKLSPLAPTGKAIKGFHLFASTTSGLPEHQPTGNSLLKFNHQSTHGAHC